LYKRVILALSYQQEMSLYQLHLEQRNIADRSENILTSLE